MKKIALGLLITLSLGVTSGCFGGGDDEAAYQGLVLPAGAYAFFESSDFLIQHPREWEVKSNEQVSSEFRDSIVSVFLSNFKDPFFTPVITIEKIKVTEDEANASFADDMIRQNEASLIEYEEVERITFSSAIGDESVTATLVRFTGKRRLQDNELEFLQAYFADSGVGYIVTGAYDPNDDNNESDKIVNSLQTFRLK